MKKNSSEILINQRQIKEEQPGMRIQRIEK